MSYPRQLKNYNLLVDPFIAQNVFLAHYDANFNDVYGHTLLLTGSPTLTAVTPLMGTNSYLNNGSGSSARYTFGAIDFDGPLTMECMFRCDSLIADGQNKFIWTCSGNVCSLTIGSAGSLAFNIRNNSVAVGFTPVINTTYYFAFSIAAGSGVNNCRSFINGNLMTTTTLASVGATFHPFFWVGNDVGNSQTFRGRIDEVRITLAQRYTAAYTPSVIPFP